MFKNDVNSRNYKNNKSRKVKSPTATSTNSPMSTGSAAITDSDNVVSYRLLDVEYSDTFKNCLKDSSIFTSRFFSISNTAETTLGTGSKEVGIRILQETSKDITKLVALELGGKNPIIVMDDARLDLALDGIIWGAFGTTGQRCTAASRVIVHEKILPLLQKKLIERTEQLRIGYGLDENIDVGPVINRSQLQKVARYVDIGKDEGATLAHGGKTVNPLPGYFFEPTMFTDVAPDMRIAQEEIFGPVVSLIKASDLDEAIQIANSVEYGLSSSIYTENMKNAFRAIEKIEAGITYINSSTIGAEIHLPFGGVKSTGNGTREAGTTAIDEFTEIKSVYIDYSGKLQKAQIDTG